MWEDVLVPQISATRTNDVYQALRGDIMSGELPPGTKLPFAALVDRYSSSVGVIREALQRLTEQNLVESRPQKGFHVIQITPDDLRDLTDARSEIEVLALRRAIRDGDTEWEALLVAAHHRLSIAPQYDDGAERFSEPWARAHAAFHHALLVGCANRRILSAATTLRDSAELYWRWSAPHYDRDRDIALEHRKILEASLSRDEDRAALLLCEHIQRTTDRLIGGTTHEDQVAPGTRN